MRPGTAPPRLSGADLHPLRLRVGSSLQVLSRVRHRGRLRHADAGAASCRDGALLRSRRFDGARESLDPRAPEGSARPLLRADAGDRRTSRRHGREVHRGCSDGGVRCTSGARGRRAACGAGRRRDARCAARAGAGRPDRRDDRGGRHRHRGAARDRRCRQRRGPTGELGRARRDPLGRADARARARCGRDGGARAARVEGQDRSGHGLPAARACTKRPNAATTRRSSAANASSPPCASHARRRSRKNGACSSRSSGIRASASHDSPRRRSRLSMHGSSPRAACRTARESRTGPWSRC